MSGEISELKDSETNDISFLEILKLSCGTSHSNTNCMSKKLISLDRYGCFIIIQSDCFLLATIRDILKIKMKRSPKDFSIAKNFRFNRIQMDAIIETAEINFSQTQICICVKIGDKHVVKIFEVVDLLEQRSKNSPSPLKTVAISLGHGVQKISIMRADLNENTFLIWSQSSFVIIGSDKDVFQKKYDDELVSACISPDGTKCVSALICSTISIFDLKSLREEKLFILQNLYPHTFSLFKVFYMSWENPKRLFILYHHLERESTNLIILEDFEQKGKAYITNDFCFNPPSFESLVTGEIAALKNRQMRVITTNTSTGVFCVHIDENSIWTVSGFSDTGCVSLPVEENSGADTFSISSTFHYSLFYPSLIPDLCKFSSKIIFAILTTSDVLCLYFVESEKNMLHPNLNSFTNVTYHNLETSNIIEFLQVDQASSAKTVNNQKFVFPISPVPSRPSCDATSTEDLNKIEKPMISLQLQDTHRFSVRQENIEITADKSNFIVESAFRIFTDEIVKINNMINSLTHSENIHAQKYPDITMSLKKLQEESNKLFDEQKNILSLKMTLIESTQNIVKIIHDLQCSTVEMRYFIDTVYAGNEIKSPKTIENSLKNKIYEFPSLVLNMLNSCRNSLVFLQNFSAYSHNSSRLPCHPSTKEPINLGLLQKILHTHIGLINNLQFKLISLEAECFFSPAWQCSPSFLSDSLNLLNLKCVSTPVTVFPVIRDEKIKERKFKDIIHKLSSHRDVKTIQFKTFSSCIKVKNDEDMNDTSLTQIHHPVPNMKNIKPYASFSTVQFRKSIQQIDEPSPKLSESLMLTKLEGPNNTKKVLETEIPPYSLLTSPKTDNILNSKPEITVSSIPVIQSSQLATSASVTPPTSLNMSSFSITSGIGESKSDSNIPNSDFSHLMIPSNLKLESYKPLENTPTSSINPLCVSISHPSISISNSNNISSSSVLPNILSSKSSQITDVPIFSNSNKQPSSSPLKQSSSSISNHSSLPISFSPQSYSSSISLPKTKESTSVLDQKTQSQPSTLLFGNSQSSLQYQSANNSHFQLSTSSQSKNCQPSTLLQGFPVQLPQKTSNLQTPFSESNKLFGSTEKFNTNFSTNLKPGSHTEGFGAPKPSFGASTPAFGSSVAQPFSGGFNLSASSIFAKSASSSETRSHLPIQSSSSPSSISSSTFPLIQNKSNISFEQTKIFQSEHSSKFTTWRENKS